MLLRVHSGPDPTRLMETTLNGSDRLLALFSKPDSTPATATLELNEDDIFITGSEFPKSNPNSRSSAAGHRISYRDFGILAALLDRNPNPNPSLIPKLSMSSSSAMAIPPATKAGEKEVVHRSSAPVSMRVVNGRRKGTGIDEEEDDDDEMMTWTMLPPHEMVARREGRGRGPSPMTTFSVLEGAGRTLKGSDLRRVRNAVFRRTGFID